MFVKKKGVFSFTEKCQLMTERVMELQNHHIYNSKYDKLIFERSSIEVTTIVDNTVEKTDIYTISRCDSPNYSFG